MGGGFALLTAASGFEAAAVNYGQLPRDLDTILAGACQRIERFFAMHLQ
jgi:carboxymethylenebutenolidase